MVKISHKSTNDIIEDNGDWLLVEISTPAFPNAKMACDKDVWGRRPDGRVFAHQPHGSNYIYAVRSGGGKNAPFHHLALMPCDGLEFDHIEHGTIDFVDNRRSNLRLVTHTQNCMNRGIRSDNNSGTPGVYMNGGKGKWHAQIMINRNKKHLGYFADKQDAIDARRVAEEKYFGEFAYKGRTPSENR